MTDTKPCKADDCDAILTRRPGEPDACWAKRVWCSNRCASRHHRRAQMARFAAAGLTSNGTPPVPTAVAVARRKAGRKRGEHVLELRPAPLPVVTSGDGRVDAAMHKLRRIGPVWPCSKETPGDERWFVINQRMSAAEMVAMAEARG